MGRGEVKRAKVDSKIRRFSEFAMIAWDRGTGIAHPLHAHMVVKVEVHELLGSGVAGNSDALVVCLAILSTGNRL